MTTDEATSAAAGRPRAAGSWSAVRASSGATSSGRLLGDARDRAASRSSTTSLPDSAWHFASVAEDPRLASGRGRRQGSRRVDRCDVRTRPASSISPRTPTSPAAMTEPDVDFWEGTFLTHHVVEAMRRTSTPAPRSTRPGAASTAISDTKRPSRTGRAWSRPPPTAHRSSSGEAMIVAVLPHVRPVRCCVPLRQRRRTEPDPRRRLRFRPATSDRARHLDILGDGQQSKSYIHVSDVMAAVLLADRLAPTAVRRLQRRPPTTTSRSPRSPTWRARVVGLDPATVEYRYSGRRPWLEGRRPGGAAQHRQDPGSSAGDPRWTSAAGPDRRRWQAMAERGRCQLDA